MDLPRGWAMLFVLFAAIGGVIAVRWQIQVSHLTMAFAAPFMQIRDVDWDSADNAKRAHRDP